MRAFCFVNPGKPEHEAEGKTNLPLLTSNLELETRNLVNQ